MGAAADFFIHASEEEKAKVYEKVLLKSAESQLEILSEVNLFCIRLKALRKSLGMTQGDFASHLGSKVWAQDINRYERGVKEPSLERIISICKKTGVDANYLLGISQIDLVVNNNLMK